MQPVKGRTGARRLPALVFAFALMWLMVGSGGIPAQGAVRPAARVARIVASGTGHAHSHAVAHKQGSLAIAVSVFGIIMVIVLLFVLGSISVRRRTGDTPNGREGGRGSRPGRGLFG